MQSTVHHQPWNTETKGFLPIYEGFVSPQTIANIQNVLIESLYTLKSIGKCQRSALLTKNKTEKDVILVMSTQAWGKGIRSIRPRARWEWQSPIQFRHQSGALTTELLSVLDSIYVVVQFYPWFKIYFLLFPTHYHVIITHYHTQKQKKKNFEPRIKLNHNIYTMRTYIPCGAKFLREACGSLILRIAVTTFAGSTFLRLSYSVTVKFLRMAIVLANDKKPGKILTANLWLPPALTNVPEILLAIFWAIQTPSCNWKQ